MALTSSNRASIKTLGTVEKSFTSSNSVLESSAVLLGDYSASKTSVVENVFYDISTATEAAETFGYGEELHRMAMYHFKANSNSVKMVALTPDASGTAATFTLTFTDDATSAGTYVLRAGSYLVEEALSISIVSGETPTEQATKVAAAVNALQSLPLTAEAALGVVTFTAKALNITSNDINITLNQKTTDSTAPSGTSYVLATDVVGAGVADVQSALNLLASTNAGWNTSIVQPYISTLIQDQILAIVGNPNDKTKLYDSIDYRPFVSHVVDTAPSLAGLNSLIAITELRSNDCANVYFSAPDSPEAGYELASFFNGLIALAAENSPTKAYTVLKSGILYGPLDATKDWTTYSSDVDVNPYFNRDKAVTNGVTPLIYENSEMWVGDTVTPWLPDDNQNAPFKYLVNIRKIWNCQNSYLAYLNSEDIKGRPIVENTNATDIDSDAISTSTIRDGIAVVTGLLAKAAFLYGDVFTLTNTRVTQSTINYDRFIVAIPMIISANFRQADGTIYVDRNTDAYTLEIEV